MARKQAIKTRYFNLEYGLLSGKIEKWKILTKAP